MLLYLNLIKDIDHYCEYPLTSNGVLMTLVQLGKCLVMLCDETNLHDFKKI